MYFRFAGAKKKKSQLFFCKNEISVGGGGASVFFNFLYHPFVFQSKQHIYEERGNKEPPPPKLRYVHAYGLLYHNVPPAKFWIFGGKA